MEKGIMLKYKGVIKPFGGQTLGKGHANLSLQQMTLRQLSPFNTQLT
jgi:hypothetical protein